MSTLSGKYELGEEIGGGGMAEVFRAVTRGAEGFQRTVAIKRIRSSVSSDKHFGEMFVREARLASRLNHPNIVQTIDFDRDETGRFFLVMELISGVDLRALRGTGPLPVPVSAYIASEVLRGLDHAHAMDDEGRRVCIVHRDISPHNIMLSWQGAVKIVDFGIAKAIEGSMVSRSGSLKGKVSYMSPEQVHGQVLDGRSDLFALGIVLHELLTSSRLFVGRTDAETLSMLLTKPIPRPRDLNPEVPEDLDRVVMRLLSRERDGRYSSALEVVEELASSSSASPRARLDLESLLVARFAERAPRRGRPSSVPPVAERAAFDPMGPTLQAAPRAAAPAVESAPTAQGHKHARSRAEVKRTLTAEDAQPGPREALGGQGVPRGWVADAAVLESAGPSSRLRRGLWIAGTLGAFATVVGVAVLGPWNEGIAAHEQVISMIDAATEGAPHAPAAEPAVPLDAAPSAESSEIRASSASTGPATLILRVSPWAEIEIDGKERGQTPKTLELSPGKHDLVLRNPSLDREESMTVRLRPGKTKEISLDWAE